MIGLGQELRLFLRQRLAGPTLALLAVLSAISIGAGMLEIRRQTEAIARIQPLQAAEEAAVAAWVSREGDAGNAAYYTFHATWDRPSALAFAALGQRDVAPYVLRVRALALESQIHEGESYNAELALPGRFDWAFVLTFLAPLILIVLLHDLISSEREAGRLQALQAAAGRPGQAACQGQPGAQEQQTGGRGRKGLGGGGGPVDEVGRLAPGAWIDPDATAGLRVAVAVAVVRVGQALGLEAIQPLDDGVAVGLGLSQEPPVTLQVRPGRGHGQAPHRQGRTDTSQGQSEAGLALLVCELTLGVRLEEG
jgi:hypothetical protein